MHWVVQNNLFSERAIAEMVSLLARYGIPHDVVKVIPFRGGIDPVVNPSNPVVVIGSYSLSFYAQDHGWLPGSWMGRNAHLGIDDFSFASCFENHGEHMLNAAAKVLPFSGALDHDMNEFFIRPDGDGKLFTGKVITRDEFADWQMKVAKADTTWTIQPNTPVVVSPVRQIISETRFVIVNGEVVTGSQYKRAGSVLYSPMVEPSVEEYAHSRAAVWTPDAVCVMDIALTPDGCRIVEFNNFNSAGWYDCNVSKIIQAIEGLE